MSDRADSSAHPQAAAIDRTYVSHHECDTDPVSPRAELCDELAGSRLADEFYAVAPPLPGAVKGARVDSQAMPAVLLARAEAAGGGVAGVAILGPVRPELLIVDLDGCAELVMTRVIAAATDAGAVLGYLAASGSPDSRHVGFAVTPAIRGAASAAIDAVRVEANLHRLAVDVRSVQGHLRYPGSASLKGTGRCLPVDGDGSPMTSVAAVARLRAALSAVADGALDLAVTPTPAPATSPKARLRPVSSPPPSAGVEVDELDGEISRWELEPERAWRAPTPITSDGFKILDRAVDPELRERIMRDRTKANYTASERDQARWKRENSSQLATDGAWVLWRSGIRSWSVARHYYRRHRCFAKYAERDAAARKEGTRAGHCYDEWQKIKRRALNHRPALPSGEAAFIAQVLAEVARWDDPAAVAAAAHVVHHRFSDGYGTYTARPIAVRELMLWMGVSRTTAHTLRKTLVERGLLTLEIPHDCRTARHEADCFRLHVPSPKYRTDLEHDLTPRGYYTHPLWGDLGQSTRHTYEKLSADPVSTAQIAAMTGQTAGTASHGVLRQLRALEAFGLATRHGTGNTTTWTRGPATLDDAADQHGATARHEVLVATVNTERKAWHATTYRTSNTARRRLAYLHKRQHEMLASALVERGAGAVQQPTVLSAAHLAAAKQPRQLTMPLEMLSAESWGPS